MEESFDVGRFIRVALTGAALAIAADYAYTNYGAEISEFITELVGLLAKGDISDFPGSNEGAPA